MLNLSEVLIQEFGLEGFEDLERLIKERAKGEIHFSMDVKPPFSDTPADWENRLEAAFTVANKA